MALGIGSILSAGASIIGGLSAADAASSAADTQAASGAAALAEQTREFNIGQAALKPYEQFGQNALFTLADYLGIKPPPAAAQTAAPATQTVQGIPFQTPISVEGGMQDGPIQYRYPDGTVGDTPTKTIASSAAPASAAPPNTVTAGPNTGSLLKPFSFDITQDPGYQFRLDQGLKGVENSASATGSQLSGATLKELLRYGQDYASGEFNTAFERDQATKNQVYSMLSGAAGMGEGATNTSVQAGSSNANAIGNTLTGIGNAKAGGIVGSANAFSSGLTGAGNSIMQAQLLKTILNPSTSGVTGGVTLPPSGAIDFPTDY